MSFDVVKYPVSKESVRATVRRQLVKEALLNNKISPEKLRALCEARVGEEISGEVQGARYRINSIDTANIANSTLEVIAYPPYPKAVGRTFKLQRVIDTQGTDHPVVKALVDGLSDAASDFDSRAQAAVDSLEVSPGVPAYMSPSGVPGDELSFVQTEIRPGGDLESVDVSSEAEFEDAMAAETSVDSERIESDLEKVYLRDPAYRDLRGLEVLVPDVQRDALEKIANRGALVAYINSSTPGEEDAKQAIKLIIDAVALPGTEISVPDEPTSERYTSQTDQAVMDFQRYVGFVGRDVDGKVGQNTAKALLGRPSDDWLKFRGSRTNGPLWPAAVSRAESLEQTSGVRAPGIYAFEARESSHNPGAFAWNGHVFMRNLESEEEREQAVAAGFKTRGDSRYGQNANSSFRVAYDINPKAAIIGGAWGLYQVLGATSLEQYDSPEDFLQAFNSDPTGHSMRAFNAWTAERPDFVENVNEYVKNPEGNDDRIAAAVRRYFGATNTEYADEVRGNILRYVSQTRDETA